MTEARRPRRVRWWSYRYIPVLLLGAGGVILTLQLFFLSGKQSREWVRTETRLLAQRQAQDVQRLIDRYLEDAFEVDVDAIGDGDRVVIGGIMEHVEEAGVHSGDSAMVMPPYKVSAYHLAIIRDETERIGLALGLRGLMNVQYAIKDEVVYVLEVNPRSSRTVPFSSSKGVSSRQDGLVRFPRKLPEKVFPPRLLTALITPPEKRPYSAEMPEVRTCVSSMASSMKRSCGLPKRLSLTSTPSSMKTLS